MKRIIKLAVYGIAIAALVSCQKDEPQKTQSWPEWFETATPFDKETHVIFVDGFDFVTHPSVLPGCSPRWPEHNLHVYEVRMYAPFLRKNIKDRAYR